MLQTPGRLNLFNFKSFNVLLDYAHILQVFDTTIPRKHGKESKNCGIIAGIGDRRQEEDNEGIGKVAAEMFDEIIIRQDKHLRGMKDTEIIAMLKNGILSHDPNKKITIIPSEKEAIKHAIENAIPGL